MSQPRKLNNIQALRAIAAILVVLVHAAEDPVLEIFYYIGFVGVDIFFVISGVVLTLATYPHLGERGYFGTFIRRRAARLYSGYWVAMLLFGGLLWFGLVEMRENADVWKSVFLFPQRGMYQVFPVAWTLIYEVLFYTVFACALLFPKKYFEPFLLCWFAILVVAACVIQREFMVTSFPVIYLFSPLQFEFLMGCLVGILVIKKVYFNPKLCVLLGGVIIVGVASVTYEDMLRGQDKTLMRAMCYGSGSALCLYGLMVCEIKHMFVMPLWLSKLGESSYSLYLTHSIVFYLVVNYVYPASDNVVIRNSQGVVVTLASVVYGYYHYKWLERPALKMTNKLFARLNFSVFNR